MSFSTEMTNEELQTAIDKAVSHYLHLRAKANSQDYATRDCMHKHLSKLLETQHARAKRIKNMRWPKL